MSRRDEPSTLLSALWGQPEAEGPDRRPVLTVSAVVAAAVGIAQTDGVEAVSMNRIAKRLRCSPMALYRYVTNKQELLALMVEWALEAVPPPAIDGLTWRRGLTTWAWGMQALFREHRWLAALNLARIPFGPRRLAWLECGIAALSETGLSETEKVNVVQLINGFAFADARAAPDPTPPEDEQPPDFLALVEHIDARTYPAVIRAVDGGAFAQDAGAAHTFEFGLERILDGVDTLVGESAERRSG